MSSEGTWLHVQAAGMDLLLSTLDLREVVVPAPVLPLPGGPKGIQGVVIHQGEFLPVLAWEELPGCLPSAGPPVAMAVLRPRLGLPLTRMLGTLNLSPAAWEDMDESDPSYSWMGGAALVEGLRARRLDLDRLMGWLQRHRNQR